MLQYTLSLIPADPAAWTFDAYNNHFSIVASDILFYDVKILREPVWFFSNGGQIAIRCISLGLNRAIYTYVYICLWLEWTGFIKRYKKDKHLSEPHQQTTTTEHLVPDLEQVLTNAEGLNVLTCTNLQLKTY